MATLKIGEVAQAAAVSVDTVRFYERRGLLPPPARTASGYRQYGPATIERIRFIRSLQALGFELNDVVDLLAAVDGGTATCETERHRFDMVLARIDEQIAELQAMRQSVAEVVEGCRAGRCRIREHFTEPH